MQEEATRVGLLVAENQSVLVHQAFDTYTEEELVDCQHQPNTRNPENTVNSAESHHEMEILFVFYSPIKCIILK